MLAHLLFIVAHQSRPALDHDWLIIATAGLSICAGDPYDFHCADLSRKGGLACFTLEDALKRMGFCYRQSRHDVWARVCWPAKS